MSVKKALANLNGKRVIKRVTGIPTVETTEDYRLELLAMLEASKDRLEDCGLSIDDFKDEGDKFTLGAHYWLKPKLKAIEYGVLTVRSKDYYFTADGAIEGVYGDKKGLTYSPDLDKVEKPLTMGFSANRGALLSFELESKSGAKA
jgi:hypothetical protein